MVELISEDFCAHAKIVLAPRQEYDVRDVKIIIGCFASVVMRVSKLKGAENLNLGNVLSWGSLKLFIPTS